MVHHKLKRHVFWETALWVKTTVWALAPPLRLLLAPQLLALSLVLFLVESEEGPDPDGGDDEDAGMPPPPEPPAARISNPSAAKKHSDGVPAWRFSRGAGGAGGCSGPWMAEVLGDDSGACQNFLLEHCLRASRNATPPQASDGGDGEGNADGKQEAMAARISGPSGPHCDGGKMNCNKGFGEIR